MNNNRCVCCNEIIPEGAQVCYCCTTGISPTVLKEIKRRMWDIVRREGIEITNQNIDWLLERACK